MIPVTWALVADRSHARILESRSPTRLVTVEEIDHPEGHWQDRDVGTDKGGRVFDRVGTGRHTMETRIAPHERFADAFAKLLAAKLRDARIAGRYERVVLAAEPTFLGRLRRALDPATRKRVAGELAKHLLGAGDRDLREHLAPLMRPALSRSRPARSARARRAPA